MTYAGRGALGRFCGQDTGSSLVPMYRAAIDYLKMYQGPSLAQCKYTYRVWYIDSVNQSNFMKPNVEIRRT